MAAPADSQSTRRLPIMLVADDQILPESCITKMQLGADVATQWAKATGQQYHVATPDKTAMLLIGPAAQPALYNRNPVFLSGSPVPCTLLKKWVGIWWDNQLTFVPFMQDRIKCGRAAFQPLLALARERLAPLAEIRSAMIAKVENTILYGSIFLFLVPAAIDQLVKLQLEFERALLSAPPWVPSSHIRAAGGWSLSWGDRLVLDALTFRADLWCCEKGMLVRAAWSAAQHFPGHTFARTSKQALVSLGSPEVYEFAGWKEFLADGIAVLPNYKAALKAVLVAHSQAQWKASFLKSAPPPYMLVQQFPCCAGTRLLDAGFLGHISFAEHGNRFG